ncbi:transketolase C-terminal domain-containing protein [Desulfosoma caldarium]|uniref:Pyruvate ferredoxin oxidoreductase alpha subunit/2-oxoisovalerate ferredoxin oxidoreductase alpha subunit n=1 Tax=Desulfosoma caldarium TaxID=610254 RepID=A0A3N1VGG1_9BACT|nr:transketolase C-terminal domain-containing protein [Desulfosoma caldarium]ROR01953.1 pyruvate ferredoxin oxidoreductase alpha subunit/2-oxoisovalerate ferredoxin oxidoreductase alpha subunit [Desulfosoma caldarium]
MAAQILTGNQTAALAAKLCRVQVVAAYPITPQSKIPEVLSEYVERGELQAEFVRVESEHSAMGVCISASLVGARAFTATAANGLAYMHEQLHWAAGARVPIVMPVTNRGLGAPWTILNDMQDSIAQRDTGWMQLYCQNNQEILDQIILGYKVAERLLVPVMVCFDGFRLSHTMMPVDVPDQEAVDAFLPPFTPPYQLDPERPININPVVMTDPLPGSDGRLHPGYMGIRRRLQEALESAVDVIAEEGRIFGERFGRSYEHPIIEYQLDDAEIVFVTMGSLGSEASEACDLLREQGIRAGVASLRVFRPFPKQAVRDSLCRAPRLAVVEKAISYGLEGALATEIKAALYGLNDRQPIVANYIVGLGGKDVKPSDLCDIARQALTFGRHEDAPSHAIWFSNEI